MGDGMNPVNLEPNVGPPEFTKQMEREAQQPEEPFIWWRQMLGWVAAMRRDQAEANGQSARQTYALEQLWLPPAPRRRCGRPLLPETRRRLQFLGLFPGWLPVLLCRPGRPQSPLLSRSHGEVG